MNCALLIMNYFVPLQLIYVNVEKDARNINTRSGDAGVTY